VDDYEELATAGLLETGSNPCDGSTVDEKTCTVTATTVTKKEWEITGSLGPEWFNVSATTGGDTSVTIGASCTWGPLNDWCQGCKLKAGVWWKKTTKESACYASFRSGTDCLNNYTTVNIDCIHVSGTIKKLNTPPQFCTQVPYTPPAGCRVQCPH
jgi:hypothetical protein